MKLKKQLLLIAALCGASASAFATETKTVQTNDLNSTKLESIRNSVSILKKANLDIKQGRDLGNVYFLQLNAKGPRGQSKIIEAFVDKKTHAIYIGGGYDAEGKKISFPLDTAKIDEGVAFTYGNGKKDLYVVTDPKCPYCTKFFNEADKKISKDFKVHVILLALPMHPEAKKINSYIISGKDNAEKYNRYVEMMSKDTKDKESLYKDFKVNSELEARSSYASKELGVQGTPTFFERNGDKFSPTHWNQLVPRTK